MMDLRTLKVIKALKQKDGSVLWIVGTALAENRTDFLRYFTVHDLTHALYEAVQDYIEDCDDPRAEIQRYFYMCTNNTSILFSQEEYYCLASFLTQIQVRRDGKFINGFDSRFEHCLDDVKFGEEEKK